MANESTPPRTAEPQPSSTDIGPGDSSHIVFNAGDRQRRKLERQLAASEQTISRLKAETYSLQKRRNDLNDRVTKLTRQLEREKQSRRNEYKARISLEKRLASEIERANRFKSAYDRLKSHPILRLARAVTAPMKGKPTFLGQTPPFAIRSSNAPAAVHHSPAAVPSQPESVTVVQKISSMYRREGQIREAKDLLDTLPDSFQPNPSDKVLFDQVSGAARLLAGGVAIPERSIGIGYVPQPGRIMYCAHSTGEFNSNGYSTRTSGLTKALVTLGSDIVVAARPGYPWDAKTHQEPETKNRFESTPEGVKTIYNPGTSWSRLALDEYIHEAADIYAREGMINRPSRIVAASNHVTALPALIAARRLGVPFAYEVRGLWEVTEASGTEGYDQSERFALAVQLETLVATEADHVFAITRQVRDELIRRGVDEEKITLLPNAADIYEFSPMRPEAALATKHRLHNGITIGYAGSILAYEGLDLVIRALSELKDGGVSAKFIVVGDGPALTGLKQLTQELKVDDRVEFVGRVPSSVVPRYVEIFDVVVCPRVSSVVTEMVSPLKPLEAMSAGKTVIGSDVAPLADLLGTDGTRGVLFKAGDSSELATTITNLSKDRALREQIGREARQWIRNNRSWEIIASEQIVALDGISAAKVASVDQSLSDVTMALISDEFTRTSIEADVKLVLPTPSNWRTLLVDHTIDILLVESAWEGNSGSWSRKIGYYDDEECKDLRELLEYCRSNGIPTVFWNKEDPVHFNRFRKTAKFFDHVFTTDANCLKEYWAHRGSHLKTLASLPFWAQPTLHNPLPTGEVRDSTVAYGGSYYGERFAKRSKELVALLDAAIPYGLKIYDRQFDNAESPYKFPEQLQDFVQGGLDYPDMVKAYKNHAAHINVNSVSDSPTMFSRRIFELAGCGTPFISGPGLEVGGIFGDAIPSSFNKKSAIERLDLWMNDEYSRVAAAWEALRIVYRSHLSVHRLAYILRTSGINVSSAGLPSYVLRVDDLNMNATKRILGQSHLPTAIVTSSDLETAVIEAFARLQVEILSKEPDADQLFVADYNDMFEDALVAEDLATAIRYSGANAASINEAILSNKSTSLWALTTEENTASDMSRIGHVPAPVVVVQRLPLRNEVSIELDSTLFPRADEPRNILIAGHDLKFADQIIEGLESAGHNVVIDHWAGHAQHDESLSRQLLLDADVIFCEWSLGNLAWYSKNKLPGQRLVSRFHFQEVITKYPAEVEFDNVDKLIFVGEYLRRTANFKFGIPEALTKVVFNTVDVQGLDRPKTTDARFNLGLVGMVPEHKRLDVALDLLAKLRSQDDRYHLYIKGRRPEEYPWMAARKQEMEFYEAQYNRIENDPSLIGGVTFDEHGSDMQGWYQKIGIALSVSDFESFHYTIADGAASGAVPVSLAWPGADQIYPALWLGNSVEALAQRIQSSNENVDAFRAASNEAKAFAVRAFSKKETLDVLISDIVG